MTPTDKPSVFCADIGSEVRGNFGWHGFGSSIPPREGSKIDDFIDSIVEILNTLPKVAIGFEAPLFVPLRNDSRSLLKQRNGESGRSFSAGAGPPVLVAAIVQVHYILSSLKSRLEKLPPVYFDICDFRKAPNGIFFWEAFVSGKIKNTRSTDNTHIFDARLAVQTFNKNYANLENINILRDDSEVLSLVGTALVRAGWSHDVNLLTRSLLVLRAEHQTEK